jgi:hypothetical protein
MRSRIAKARRPRAAARLFASATAFLLVVGQLGSYAHLVSVRHEVCAEHGELVDVHGGAVATASTEAAGPDARLASSSRAEPGHQHEHCALAPHRRESAVDSPYHHAIGQAPPAAASLSSIARLAPLASQSIYRLAPKTSPPA